MPAPVCRNDVMAGSMADEGLKAIERHHNSHRPHQGLGNKIPIEYEYPDKPAPPHKVKCDSALGGLLNHYYVDTGHGCNGKAA